MRYDILKPSTPKMPALGKGTECIKLLLSQLSEDNHELFVPMFFPVLAHTSVAQNFSIPTSLGRNFVAKWPSWWQKMGVTRVNCHTSVRLAERIRQTRTEFKSNLKRESVKTS